MRAKRSVLLLADIQDPTPTAVKNAISLRRRPDAVEGGHVELRRPLS